MFLNSLRSQIATALLLSITFGCDALEAEDEAHLGKRALLNCQFAKAYKHFKKANDLYHGHKEILLGLGLSELAYFADTPEVLSLLADLGFKESLSALCSDHSQTVLGTDAGVSDQCHPLDVFRKPPSDLGSAHAPGVEAANTLAIDAITPNLTWNDVIDRLGSQKHLLENGAHHLFRAANELNAPYHLGATLGFDHVTLHTSDLELLSTVANLAVFAIDVASAYSADFSVRDSLRAYHLDDFAKLSALVTITPRDDFTPPDFENFSQALISLGSVAQSVMTAYDASLEDFQITTDDRGCEVRDFVFRFDLMPYGIANDFKKLSAIYQDGDFVLKGLTDPTITCDAIQFFESPLNFASPLYEWCEDSKTSTLHLRNLIQRLNSTCSPIPFLDQDSFARQPRIGYRLNSAWLKWTPFDLLP